MAQSEDPVCKKEHFTRAKYGILATEKETGKSRILIFKSKSKCQNKNPIEI